MSPAFSHDFLKRLSAFSKLSSGSTITLVTRNSPLSHSPKALPVYHAPLLVATGPPRAVDRPAGLRTAGATGRGEGGGGGGGPAPGAHFFRGTFSEANTPLLGAPWEGNGGRRFGWARGGPPPALPRRVTTKTTKTRAS